MLNSKWKRFLCEENDATIDKNDIENTSSKDINKEVKTSKSKSDTSQKSRKISKYELDVAFLLCNDINPIVLDMPLYYPKEDTMVQIASIPKDNDFFKTEDLQKKVAENDLDDLPTYDADKIIIKEYSKEMFDPDEYTNNVTFVKKYGKEHELSVKKYIQDIYNYPENQNAIETGQGLIDFDDKQVIMQSLIKYKDRIYAEKERKQKEALTAVEDIPEIDLNKEGKRPFGGKKISTILVNRKLKGWTDEDLKILNNSLKEYLNWEDTSGSKFLTAIPNIIKSKNIKNAKDILNAFNTNKLTWYKNKLEGKELDNEIKKWWTTVTDSLSKAESVELTELTNPAIKPTRIKEPGAVADLLVELGINPQYLVVPFTIKGTKDKNNISVIPDKQYRIIGFNDGDKIKELIALRKKVSQLKEDFLNTEDLNEQRSIMEQYQMLNKQLKTLENTATAVVKQYDKGRMVDMPFEMNLAEIYNNIKSTDELNVKEHDLANPNENLNQHKFYYVDLPPQVIQQMVDDVCNRYKDEIPYGYTVPPLLNSKTYSKYLDTPIMSEVLNLYNDENNSNYKIRKFGKKYKGLVPYNPESRMNSFPNKALKTMVK